MKIISERPSESFVTVGKRLRFMGQAITSPFIPRDQCFPDIQDRHANAVCTALFGEFLCSSQQSTAQLLILQIGPDGQQPKPPNASYSRL